MLKLLIGSSLIQMSAALLRGGGYSTAHSSLCTQTRLAHILTGNFLALRMDGQIPIIGTGNGSRTTVSCLRTYLIGTCNRRFFSGTFRNLF